MIHGLTPANYSMKGSPGGLARIDALFNSNGYTIAFSNAPLIFGAFPSLHAADATLLVLFVTHFFGYSGPKLQRNWLFIAACVYACILFWATMYLTHHYLIDVVGGACLAIGFFYFLLPQELAQPLPASRSKYEVYDLDEEAAPVRRTHSNTINSVSSGEASPHFSAADDQALALERESDLDEEQDIAYRPPSSAVPFLARSRGSAKQHGRHKNGGAGRVKQLHNHHTRTASIMSLIGPEERSEEGWGGWGIAIVPPSPRQSGPTTPRGRSTRNGQMAPRLDLEDSNSSAQ